MSEVTCTVAPSLIVVDSFSSLIVSPSKNLSTAAANGVNTALSYAGVVTIEYSLTIMWTMLN